MCKGGLLRNLESEAGLDEEKAVLAKVHFLMQQLPPGQPTLLSSGGAEVFRHADCHSEAIKRESAQGG